MFSYILSLFNHKSRSFKKMKSIIKHRTPLNSADIRCHSKRGLISVVLPVYNCEKYLEEAILSVLSQTYTNLELIIVDDGSTDNSSAIADSFLNRDARVSVIHQKNLKLPVALNNGFAAAKGEFMTWTSADNRMTPACLEILANELMLNRDIDMVYGNMRLIDENGDILRGYGWYELPIMSGNVILPDFTDNLNTYANNTIGAAFLYRAGAAALLGGYSDYKYTLEDYDYFMRMNSLLTIKHSLCKKPIYEYRMHKGSLTAKDEELGITASRPALMQLDAIRRDFYTKPIYFYADGDNKEVLSALSCCAKQVLSPQTANKLVDLSPSQIFYINFDNCYQIWTPPESIPRFLFCEESTPLTYGYDVMLCKNAASLANSEGWLSASTPQSAASFIALRAKNDILYKYEAGLK